MCCQCSGLGEAETVEPKPSSRAKKKVDTKEAKNEIQFYVRVVKGKYHGFPFSLSLLPMSMNGFK